MGLNYSDLTPVKMAVISVFFLIRNTDNLGVVINWMERIMEILVGSFKKNYAKDKQSENWLGQVM